MFKRDEVVLLLGAGASFDAGIPTSCGMISKLETLLKEDAGWQVCAPLYNFVKSGIGYADGIQGKFDNSGFNIERLVNTLDELLKSDKHPIFPFIGSWTPKLLEVTGSGFSQVESFRRKLVEQLSQHWVRLEYDEDAKYYRGLERFQEEYQFPLRVFTLNYDLCVEKACAAAGVERGFGEAKHWDWKIFENEDHLPSRIFLYKLHGSIDWTRDNRGWLVYKDRNIAPENIEIIFGTTYKLQYVDPFLFFAYEFRKRTLSDAKVIVCVGYGFGDEHINKIIAQALNSSKERKLLVVSPCKDAENMVSAISDVLGKSLVDKIRHENVTAREFLENKLTLENLAKFFPAKEAPFEEIGEAGGSPTLGEQVAEA